MIVEKLVAFVFSVSVSVLNAAPAALSETGLYADIQAKTIAEGILAFAPQYPLWSDGAAKKRWIRVPPGRKIVNRISDRWVFPAGTQLWKEFSFGGKRVETRLEQKLANGMWELVTYLWDAAEREATLAAEDGVPNVYPSGPGTTHDIPSRAQCLMCHRRGGDPVLGFEALQLSDDRDSLAPHAEPLAPGMMTLGTLAARGLLSDPPAISPRVPAATPEGRAAIGYLHSNCASCHNPNGTAGHVGLDLRHAYDAVTESEENAVMSSVNVASTTFHIPGQAETYYLKGGRPEQSSMLYRMRVTGTGRMPQIGTKLVDEEAVALIEKWIRTIAR